MKKKLYTKTKAAMDASIKGVQLALKGLREHCARDKAHAAGEGDVVASSDSWKWLHPTFSKD